MRKWRENKEMERDSFSTFPHFLFISSLSIHLQYQKLHAKNINISSVHFMQKKMHKMPKITMRRLKLALARENVYQWLEFFCISVI